MRYVAWLVRALYWYNIKSDKKDLGHIGAIKNSISAFLTSSTHELMKLYVTVWLSNLLEFGDTETLFHRNLAGSGSGTGPGLQPVTLSPMTSSGLPDMSTYPAILIYPSPAEYSQI